MYNCLPVFSSLLCNTERWSCPRQSCAVSFFILVLSWHYPSPFGTTIFYRSFLFSGYSWYIHVDILYFPKMRENLISYKQNFQGLGPIFLMCISDLNHLLFPNDQQFEYFSALEKVQSSWAFKESEQQEQYTLSLIKYMLSWEMMS